MTFRERIQDCHDKGYAILLGTDPDTQRQSWVYTQTEYITHVFSCAHELNGLAVMPVYIVSQQTLRSGPIGTLSLDDAPPLFTKNDLDGFMVGFTERILCAHAKPIN